jgi:hypothetical protein
MIVQGKLHDLQRNHVQFSARDLRLIYKREYLQSQQQIEAAEEI